MNSQEIAELTTKAIEELASTLGAGHSETLAQYLAAIGRFHKYSLHNLMLIVLQKPAATHVAGFHTWRKLGRHVHKGEKGITIFAPILQRKKEPEHETGVTVEEVLLGYRTCEVFDVSQTEGKPLASIGKVHGDARHHGDRLAAYALSLGIRLEYSEEIRPARGISEGGKITLLPDMSSAEKPPYSRTSWPTKFFITSLAARRRRKRYARPKPKRWLTSSARPSASKREPLRQTTSNCTAEIPNSCSRASITYARRRARFSTEFWKTRACPRCGRLRVVIATEFYFLGGSRRPNDPSSVTRRPPAMRMAIPVTRPTISASAG
jgi:hypothetical protein